MTSHEFVTCLRREVLEQNLDLYRQNLEGPPALNTGHAQQWPLMAEYYHSLTKDQQRIFMQVIRQVMVDTLSNVLGILDGSTLLEKYRDYFHLTYGDNPQELNGELQDIFMSFES